MNPLAGPVGTRETAVPHLADLAAVVDVLLAVQFRLRSPLFCGRSLERRSTLWFELEGRLCRSSLGVGVPFRGSGVLLHGLPACVQPEPQNRFPRRPLRYPDDVFEILVHGSRNVPEIAQTSLKAEVARVTSLPNATAYT